VHNLDSTKLKIHYQIKSTAPGSNWPLLNQEAFDASGYWVAHRNPKIVIDEITKMTIRARVDDNLQSTVASPNFGPLSSINKVRVMIWKIN
jgi:hypothetical protein